MATTRIKHVYGNVLRIAIPLDVINVRMVEGVVEQNTEQFFPNTNYPVYIVLKKTAAKFNYEASVNGNVVSMEDMGTLPIGCYNVEVLCKNDKGEPCRYMVRCVVQIVDATKEAGIEAGIEFDAESYTLDGGIFLALKGEDGNGIESITTQETDVDGGYNIVTIIMTDGTQAVFHVKNGVTGTPILPTDLVYDANYIHTDNNYTNNEKSLVGNIPSLFGRVEYDKLSRRINFYSVNDTFSRFPLAYIDAADFVRDGMVSRVQVTNGYLRITFNTDAGKDPISVPITAIFNPDNYYDKTQVDASLIGMMARNEFVSVADECIAPNKMAQVVLDSMGEELDGQQTQIITGMVFYVPSSKTIIKYTSQGTRTIGLPSTKLIYCNAVTNKTYRWNQSEMDWVQVGGSSDGSYNVTYSNGVLSFVGSTQPTYSNGILTI